MLNLHVLTKDLDYLGQFNEAIDPRYLAVLNEAGAGSFTIHSKSNQVNTTTLALGNIVRVDWIDTTIGWWVIEDLDEVLVGSSEEAEKIVVSGRGLLSLLQKSVLHPILFPAETTGLDTPLVCSPNAGIGFLGTNNSGAELPFSVSFDLLYDSDGNPWEKPVYLEFRPGQNQLDVANALSGMGHLVRVSKERTLDIYNEFGSGLFGVDKTSSAIFRKGYNILSAKRTLKGADVGSVVLAQGQVDWTELSSSAAVTTYGTRQVFLQARNATNQSQLLTAAQAFLDRISTPDYELALEVTMSPVALIDYNLGDLIRVVIPPSLDQNYRIYSIQLTTHGSPENVSVTLGVNRETVPSMARLQNTLDARATTASSGAYKVQGSPSREGQGSPHRFDWYLAGALAAGDGQGHTYVVSSRLVLDSFSAYSTYAPESNPAELDVEYSDDDGVTWYSIFSVIPTIPVDFHLSSRGTFGMRVLNPGTLVRFCIVYEGHHPIENLTVSLSGMKV